MGSRAVVVVCRDEAAARRALRRRRRRASGIVYTRTGRRFFDDPALETRVARRACARRSTAAGLWDELDTDWVVPRLRADAVVGQGPGAAAQPVRRRSARPRAAALARRVSGARAGGRARASTSARCSSATASAPSDGRALRRRLPALLLAGRRRSTTCSSRRSTCWPPRARVHVDQDHVWHMDTLAARLRRPTRSCCCATAVPGGRRRPTRRARRTAIAWWEELTGRGGEGMVVKPLDFVARGQRGPGAAGGEVPRPRVPADHLRPGVRRCPSNLERLRARGLSAQAVAGAARVRARRRGAGALRPRRAAAPRARVRLRRAGAGERAGRPAAVALREHCRSVAPRRARVGVGLPGDGHEAPVVVAAAQGQLEHALHARAARLAGRLDRGERALPRVAGADDERPDAAGLVDRSGRLQRRQALVVVVVRRRPRRQRRGRAAPAICGQLRFVGHVGVVVARADERWCQ